MKHLIIASFLILPFLTFSQEKFSKELSFITDNDLYVSVNKDRYYTSGIFLSYRHLKEPINKKLEKKIIEWQLVQEMFTPYKATVQNINQHDRPFAANLYASFGTKKVFKNNTIFSNSIHLGVIGKSAYGKELQDFIHDIYGFEKAVGWEHQIKNALNINFNADYTRFLIKNNANTFDVSWINSGKIGTVYTNFSSGIYARFSLIPLQSILNSIAFNTNLNDNNTGFNREIESFFFLKPTLRYSLYDATIQGSFLTSENEVTKEVVPLVFNISLGFKFTANRFNFGYTINYNTSKSKDLKYTSGNKFGTIIINYLLH